MKLIVSPMANGQYFDVVDIAPALAPGARVIRAAYCSKADAEMFASAPGRLAASEAALRAALDALAPFAALPTDFAHIDGQPVLTVLAGPYGPTPGRQSWAGNRTIYARDIRRAKAAMCP